jgi:NAD(P)H dehydrogenase (quinone)
MKLLVTGATGNLGGFVIEALLKKVDAENLAVSVRNPEKAEGLKAKGVDVRYGDFDKPETLESAFAGIDRLLIISANGDNETRIRQHQTALEAAEKAQVKLIVYTSVANATDSKLELAEVHRKMEDGLLSSGIPYVLLRNNWYLENEVSNIQGVLNGAPWVTSAGEGKVGWALRRDYGEAAAAVLAGSGHENKIYELSNKPLSQSELATVVGKVLGKEVNVLNVDDASYEQGLKSAGLPDFVAELFTGIQKAIRENALDVESNDFERILGRPVTSIEEAVAEIVKSL